MKIKNLLKNEKRLLLLNMGRSVVALMLLLCAIGGAMAAGDPDPIPTATPSDSGGDGTFELWDIFDKKEIVQASKDAWNEFGPAGGNLLLGVALLGTILIIVLTLISGAAVMNLGKMKSDNDTHSVGKAMMTTAVVSAIMLVLSMCFIAMFLKGWL